MLGTYVQELKMEIKKDYSRILGDLDVEKLLYKPKKRYYKKLAGLISLAIVITKLTHVHSNLDIK